MRYQREVEGIFSPVEENRFVRWCVGTAQGKLHQQLCSVDACDEQQVQHPLHTSACRQSGESCKVGVALM